jgi:hypothetical protein
LNLRRGLRQFFLATKVINSIYNGSGIRLL